MELNRRSLFFTIKAPDGQAGMAVRPIWKVREKIMSEFSQKKAPIYEALERFRRMRVVPFAVPGHKHGRGNPELVELLG